MGCRFSCKRSSISSKSKNVKVVHVDGYVEEIELPVTVAQVTGPLQKHFLFTQAQVQLLAVGSVPPLKLDHLLEPGQAYFLLPCSLFEDNISPLDLAPVTRKLVSVSQNSLSKSRKKNVLSRERCISPVSGSPGSSSPNGQFSDQQNVVSDDDRVACRQHKGCKSWKPILATIQEMSFSQRVALDLAEKVKAEASTEWLG